MALYDAASNTRAAIARHVMDTSFEPSLLELTGNL